MINSLVTGDCVQGMQRLPDECVHLVFADPPFNIGFDYGDEYDDNLDASEYSRWSRSWMEQVHRILTPDGTFWLAIGDEWAADLACGARSLGFHRRSWVIWYYTFGVNSPKKFTRSHAHLFYFTKHHTEFTFNDNEIRVPSARAVVYNDKRANPDGRLPDDTWILRPQEIPEGFPADYDTWNFPRIAGTFKRRQPGAPNQMPEQLLGRIIRACSAPGEVVLDPFVGTGTTPVVAKKLERTYIGYELSPAFAVGARKRIRDAKPGDPLDSPIAN
jgi:site-specific DNA-methyltransferase (adenine-specific)